MASRLSVFISSKMQELAAERRAIQELLPALSNDLVQLQPWVFEQDAPASNASIREVFLDVLRRSALYVGVFWNEYGEWTIDEFEHATQWAIDRHLYVKNVDSGKRDPRLQRFLDEQSDVVTGITPKWFSSVDDLREQLTKSVQVWLKDRLTRHPGDSSAIFAQLRDEIPIQSARLVGRADVIKNVRLLLEEGDRVLLQGFGGMGKTAIAATVAAQWIEDGKGPVLWLQAGSETAEILFEALAAPFQAQQSIVGSQGVQKLALMRALLGQSGATLLVLDDVWNGNALGEVLKATPRKVAVLVTSRQRYALDTIVEVGRLEAGDAQRVLGYYARHDFQNDRDAQELCRQVGYHPFALEIAGKTLKVDRITPLDLLRQISDTPHLLAMPEDFAEEGRTSIVELLDASINALDDDARHTLLAFGAFFTASASAGLLAGYLTSPQSQVEAALIRLQRRGLAEQVQQGKHAGMVYRIHDLAYSYARAVHQERTEKGDRAVEAVRQYVMQHEQDVDMLDVELSNILGAAEAARGEGNLSALLDIVGVLIGPYLSARGHSLRFLDVLDKTIPVAEALGPSADATRHVLLSKRANAYYDYGELEHALELYQQALALARSLALADREVILLSVIGKVLSDLGRDAGSVLGQAHDKALALDDDFLMGFVLENRGYNAQSRHDYAAAREYFHEEVVLAGQLGDSATLFYALLNLGTAEKDSGRLSEAIQAHDQARAIAETQANRVWLAHAIQSLAEDYQLSGDTDRGRQSWEQALLLFRESGIKAKVTEIEAVLRDTGH